MSPLLSTAVEYLSQFRAVLLITVGEGNVPFVRPVGPFVNDGPDVYFWTDPKSEKVRHIADNPAVTLYFQKEGAEYGNFTSLAVSGIMSHVVDGQELAGFLDKLGLKDPRFREWLEKGGGLETGGIYKVKANRIRFTDNSKKPNRVEVKLG